MKQRMSWVCVLLALLLAVLLAGCGATETVGAETPGTSAVQETGPAEANRKGEPPEAEPAEPEAEETAEAVTIPPIALPEPEPGVSYDMIGVIVYHGGIYTQAAYYDGHRAEALSGLVGEQLGTALGTLDEWSTQDEYAVECASNMNGPFYAVAGYDPGFRICMTGSYEEEDGSETPYLWTFERLNGITLTDGASLFERLHLRDRAVSAEVLSHADWNEGNQSARQLLEVPEETWDAFLAALYESSVQAIDYESAPDFYQNPRQGHLYVALEDGTEVELRLLDGGWVCYQPLGWYAVQMPGTAFDALLKACGA